MSALTVEIDFLVRERSRTTKTGTWSLSCTTCMDLLATFARWTIQMARWSLQKEERRFHPLQRSPARIWP